MRQLKKSRNDGLDQQLPQDDSKFDTEDLEEGVANESKVQDMMSNFLVLEKKGKINLSDMNQPSVFAKPSSSSSVSIKPADLILNQHC